MPLKACWFVECMQSAGIDVGAADANRFPQRSQTGCCFGLA